jgi:hypothetical protein
MTKEFYAPPQGGLGINRETVGIEQHNGLEIRPVIGLYMGFCEEFELFPDEFDALAVTTFHGHDVGFHLDAVALVDVMQKFVQQAAFPREGFPVKNDVGDFLGRQEILEFSANVGVVIFPRHLAVPIQDTTRKCSICVFTPLTIFEF